MKILVCGDKHLKITRFDKSKRFLEWLNDKVTEIRPDLVVALGDDMDTHAVLRAEIMAEFRRHVDHVVTLCPMVYLVGNHDYYKPGDITYHAMQSFKDLIYGFNVIDSHQVLYDMDFVPYIHNIDQFPEVSRDICFAHQTFVGADYGYHRPDVGVESDKLASKIIISGHVHKRQEFGKVIYPGSPFAVNMNDLDQDKGIMMFDTDTYKKTFVQSPFPRWKSVRFDLDNESTVDSLHSMLESMLNVSDNWVLMLNGPKSELTSYLSSKLFLDFKKDKNVTTRLTFIDKIKKNISISSFSIKNIVSEYLDKTYSGVVDKSKIVEFAIDLIGDVDKRS